MNGLPNQRAQSMPGRSRTPVKPTSEVAHQPGQQPAARELTRFALPISPGQDAHILLRWPMTEAEWDRIMVVLEAMKPALVRDQGSAVECSAERSRAPRDNGGARGGTRLGNPCDEDGLTR